MLFNPMTDLVGQNSQNFLLRMGSQQSVKKNDSLVSSNTGEIGIRMLAPFTCIHLKNTFDVETHLFHQGPNALNQRLVLDRFEFIEERSN
jgi:hypothetical protein